MQLASSFLYGSPMLRADSPLSDDQIRRVAPSIFAEGKHESRSRRYTYIPTIDVLRGLRNEGFQPFMVCQTRVRDQGKREFTKHMLRLRHVDQITGEEADEIVLLNSHDGTSSYQMLAGTFRFVCQNGMIAGENLADIRVPHKGIVIQDVINGAFDVLDGFDLIREQKDGMRAMTLDRDEQQAFARSALALRYDPTDAETPAPITESRLLSPRRFEDRRDDLWTVFNRVQENLTKGGLHGRSRSGRALSTRPIAGIDQNVKLNRALWMLADAMRQMKA
jgi:Domain of unknown function (DUF932)